MFDIGFTEILLIGIVALVVIGPDKLPGTVRQLLIQIKNLKSHIASVKSDVAEELDIQDIKQQLRQEKAELKNVVGYDDLHESLNELDELKKEHRKNFDFFDDTISSEQIEKDIDRLIHQHGPQLPDPNEHADTGVEKSPEDVKSNKA